jgi:hypothetical protein
MSTGYYQRTGRLDANGRRIYEWIARNGIAASGTGSAMATRPPE